MYSDHIVIVSGSFFVFSLYLSSLSSLSGFDLAPLVAERSIFTASDYNFICMCYVYARIHFNKYDACVRACACSEIT